MSQKKEDNTDDCGCPHTEKNSTYKKTINLAIQGGGSHGAFAWGVIDKIIEDGRLKVDGLCGTSAGAMNAVVYAYGNMTGGPDGAREALHNFWSDVSEAGTAFNPLKNTPWDGLFDNMRVDKSLSYTLFDLMSKTFSPYQFNPLNFNPLQDVLEKTIDFEVLKKCQETRLFINTTKVSTGKVRVFTTDEITLDVVMASACLPQLFQAVKIGEDHYWDGGYMGNPALFPLFYHTDTRDVLIVHINPLERKELPVSANEIMDRLNEITFNSSLLKEMRAIAFVTKLIEEDWLKDEHKHKLKHMLIHSIRADKILDDLDVASKFNVDWPFLTNLRDRGRQSAEKWLEQHYSSIGEESTVNLRNEFLDIGADHVG